MRQICSNMAGSIWKILVAPGDQVQDGQDVVILESMKMEIPITAEVSGTVRRVNCKKGDFVNDGDPLIDLE